MVTRKTLFAILLMGVSILNIQAQTMAKDEIQLVVSGDGVNKEEATKTALRSAIEQTYGTFVSANTEVLNDEIVKDEIATVTSGNIKSFEYVSENALDGKYFVTLKAIVSIGKLVEYTKSKGATTELAGATFAMNIKMKELNKRNESEVLYNLVSESEKILPYVFDYEIIVEEPRAVTEMRRVNDSYFIKEDEGIYKCETTVILKSNKNTTKFYDLFYTTIASIAVSETEQQEYEKANIDLSGTRFGPGFVLRSDHVFLQYISAYLENTIIWYLFNFKVSDGLWTYEFIPLELLNKAAKATINPLNVRELRIEHTHHFKELIVNTKSDVSYAVHSPRQMGGVGVHVNVGEAEFYNCPSALFRPLACGEEIYSIVFTLYYTLDELERIKKFTVEPKKQR